MALRYYAIIKVVQATLDLAGQGDNRYGTRRSIQCSFSVCPS